MARGAVSEVLDLAGGLKPNVVDVAFLSMDEFSSGLGATAALNPGTLIVYQMNGQVLPREHGYPARLLVPGRYGMKDRSGCGYPRADELCGLVRTAQVDNATASSRRCRASTCPPTAPPCCQGSSGSRVWPTPAIEASTRWR